MCTHTNTPGAVISVGVTASVNVALHCNGDTRGALGVTNSIRTKKTIKLILAPVFFVLTTEFMGRLHACVSVNERTWQT